MDQIYVSGQARWAGRGWGAWAVAFPSQEGGYTIASQKVKRKPVGSPNLLEREALTCALNSMPEGGNFIVITLSKWLPNVVEYPNAKLASALKRHEKIQVERVTLTEMPAPLAYTRDKAITLAEMDDAHFACLKKQKKRKWERRERRRRKRGAKGQEPTQHHEENTDGTALH